MLTLRDCIDFSDLKEEEILAIAECEQIPIVTALEEGESMVHTTQGRKRIAFMIKGQAEMCERMGNTVHAQHLNRVYDAFIKRFGKN
ncbi:MULTISPECIES: hypothetical protein [Thalassospira]|jgi:hypothetical protein|uniref:Uncharacterized protein n=1 Tax=Thalassospira povalilytica TaxID=732237 RepID=A0A8I1M7C1_9PROT|nr:MULTISPECIES: hypothetical protein [Thalassospira]MEE3043642.1 hypothetical protein [Pseudomonadota bacterium]RCK27538.1 hypothetical protein TH8_06505 [Thalassospira profundimaris]KZB65265.1 hypothetical protein AUQ42_01830 [Thalassospira sp. MCCC 1A02491]MAL39947.1 hypothetical protein [Thalassospira sp.]MBN8196648.1 hypothetical protein [Thalassospira povalilytica]|tara:strand:- start:472 stop:732 length:261 start_codon:yes stop_codon:yes gene_type:complete